MVKPGELDCSLRRAHRRHRLRAELAVRPAARDGRAHRDGRPLGRDQRTDVKPPRHDVGHAIAGALLALANVVEERGHEEIMIVVVTALQKPARGSRAVALVTRRLALEEGQARRRQVVTRDGEILGTGPEKGLAELANAIEHQPTISRNTSAAPPKIQLRGLYCGAMKLSATNPRRSPGIQFPADAKGLARSAGSTPSTTLKPSSG